MYIVSLYPGMRFHFTIDRIGFLFYIILLCLIRLWCTAIHVCIFPFCATIYYLKSVDISHEFYYLFVMCCNSFAKLLYDINSPSYLLYFVIFARSKNCGGRETTVAR
jgi:hypothetical protein